MSHGAAPAGSLVVLDLDGTLVNQAAAAEAWTVEFVAEWHLPDAAVGRIFAALTASTPKDVAFEAIVAHWQLPVSATVVWDSYRERMPQLVRCTDADKAALRRLRAAGWRLGIASNGMADNQEGKIRNAGLADLIDGWVISSEVGIRKPDPMIFELLARKLGCPLDGWMIGDSLEYDVAGGAAAGLSTAWITESAASAVGSVSPTITARSVARVAEVIMAGGAS